MKDSYGNTEFSLSGWLKGKDVLIRHKWPEEKPEDYKGNRFHDTSKFSAGAGVWLRWNQEITHWWNLPEVTE